MAGVRRVWTNSGRVFVAVSSDDRVAERLGGDASTIAGSATTTFDVKSPARAASFVVGATCGHLVESRGGVVAFAGDPLTPDVCQVIASRLLDVSEAEDHQAALERSLRDVPLDVVAAAISNSGDMAMLASWTGVPPLYIYRGRGLWACSDDLERIVAAIEVTGGSLTLDTSYVARFVTAIAPPHLLPELEPSVFAEVRYLPGGHVARFDGTTLTIRRYWRYWETERAASKVVPGRVRGALVAAVRDRLGGATAGVLLSGGLDSSCVAAAVRLAGANARCYNNSFTCSPSLDEAQYVRAVVQHLGFDLTEIPSDDLWAFRDVPDQSRNRAPAEPYQAWFFAQERAVAERARADGVDVLFDGFGGDELFQPELHGGSFGLGHRACHTDRASYLRFMGELVRGRHESDPLSALQVTADTVPVFLTDALVEQAQPDRYLPDVVDAFAVLGLDAVTAMRVFAFECTHYSVYDRIWANRDVYGPDRVRRLQPFFDRRVVEAVFSAPTEDVVHGAINKPLLRRAMHGTLPSLVLQRRHKVTFEIMERRGIGAGGGEVARLRDLMQDAMVYELGLVRREEFLRCFEDVYVPDRHERIELPALKYWIWQTLTLEVWLRQWSTSTVFTPSSP